MPKPSRRLPPFAAIVFSFLVAACAAGGAASPAPSAGGSADPSLPAPSASAAPSAGPIATADDAAAAVKAANPLLLSIPPQDPNMIGQSATWQATETGDGWELVFEVGWGDCMAGCIDRHVWTYRVTRDGTVELLGEEGSPIPADILAQLGGGVPPPSIAQGVRGLVTAGPTCPVETPGDPACLPRPVPGAVLIIRGPDGAEAARVQTDQLGGFETALDPGDYVLEPQPVEGLMGTAAPMSFRVDAGASTPLEVVYDTGIRGAEPAPTG